MPACCSCKNLDSSKKVAGEVAGTKYYCKKLKTYVTGDTDACGKYESSFRNNDDISRIYKEGKQWDNDNKSVGGYLAVAVILLLLILIIYLVSPNMLR